MKLTLRNKIKEAFEKDPEIICDRGKAEETLGSNPDYLLDTFGITKSDLIRLERLGFAVKARYEVDHKSKRYISKAAKDAGLHVTGTHRVRWLIFSEVLS